MHANHRQDVDKVYAGDIAAAVGLKDVSTGDTLCDPDHPVILRVNGIPRASYRYSYRAKRQGKWRKNGCST